MWNQTKKYYCDVCDKDFDSWYCHNNCPKWRGVFASRYYCELDRDELRCEFASEIAGCHDCQYLMKGERR